MTSRDDASRRGCAALPGSSIIPWPGLAVRWRIGRRGPTAGRVSLRRASPREMRAYSCPMLPHMAMIAVRLELPEPSVPTLLCSSLRCLLNPRARQDRYVSGSGWRSPDAPITGGRSSRFSPGIILLSLAGTITCLINTSDRGARTAPETDLTLPGQRHRSTCVPP